MLGAASLTGLPLKIRQQIYRHLFDSDDISVWRDPRKDNKLRHLVHVYVSKSEARKAHRHLEMHSSSNYARWNPTELELLNKPSERLPRSIRNAGCLMPTGMAIIPWEDLGEEQRTDVWQRGYFLSTLLSCRQIHEEILPTIYGHSTFTFFDLSALSQFAKSIAPTARKCISAAYCTTMAREYGRFVYLPDFLSPTTHHRTKLQYSAGMQIPLPMLEPNNYFQSTQNGRAFQLSSMMSDCPFCDQNSLAKAAALENPTTPEERWLRKANEHRYHESSRLAVYADSSFIKL